MWRKKRILPSAPSSAVPQDDLDESRHVGVFAVVRCEEGMFLRRTKPVGARARRRQTPEAHTHHELRVSGPLLGHFLQAAHNTTMATKSTQQGEKERKGSGDRAPLRGKVDEIRGELVGGKLRGRFLHHLLELLEGRAPRVVREPQNGQLHLDARRWKNGEENLHGN